MEAVLPSHLELLTGDHLHDLASSWQFIHQSVFLVFRKCTTIHITPCQDVGPVNVLCPIIGSLGCITGNGLRIAYQGVPGAYGEAAAHKAVPGASLYVQHPQFADVFEV